MQNKTKLRYDPLASALHSREKQKNIDRHTKFWFCRINFHDNLQVQHITGREFSNAEGRKSKLCPPITKSFHYDIQIEIQKIPGNWTEL